MCRKLLYLILFVIVLAAVIRSAAYGSSQLS
jgi:hypothetical protein